MEKNIVAIGGGGFGRSIGDLKVENYIVQLSSAEKPNICFIPTATGDSDVYKVNFYRAFSKIQCNPSHIDFFQRTIDFNKHIASQEIIYIGGGNTKSMLGVWKEWGFDQTLKNAYNAGVIMSGVSAGAICWFNQGITDSWQNNLSILDCLGFVHGTCCPHYDEEKNRIPFLKNAIKNRLVNNCLAIEGNCALHLKNGEPFKSLDFGDDKKTYFITLKEDKLIHTPIDSYKL